MRPWSRTRIRSASHQRAQPVRHEDRDAPVAARAGSRRGCAPRCGRRWPRWNRRRPAPRATAAASARSTCAAAARPTATRRVRPPPCGSVRAACRCSRAAGRRRSTPSIASSSRPGVAVGDVVLHRGGEHEDVLAHHRHRLAQRGERHVADVLPVDGDRAARSRRRSAGSAARRSSCRCPAAPTRPMVSPRRAREAEVRGAPACPGPTGRRSPRCRSEARVPSMRRSGAAPAHR